MGGKLMDAYRAELPPALFVLKKKKKKSEKKYYIFNFGLNTF
jgi:hypothetical protein